MDQGIFRFTFILLRQRTVSYMFTQITVFWLGLAFKLRVCPDKKKQWPL